MVPWVHATSCCLVTFRLPFLRQVCRDEEEAPWFRQGRWTVRAWGYRHRNAENPLRLTPSNGVVGKRVSESG